LKWNPAAEPTLENILDQESLRWIFVGGKGGVGKTTTSCSLAIELSKVRDSVLIISTDPAHNLSDAFGQKITRHPTAINGFENLFAMEIDPTIDPEEMAAAQGGVPGMEAHGGLMAELTSSIPGIDEAMSFAELMKQVQTMEYQTIVFDTAPTGHTLRLIQFPQMLEKGLSRVLGMKDKFGGLLGTVTQMMGGAGGENPGEAIFGKLEQTKQIIDVVQKQFQDPDITTFVCVCIPEFLSVYETERLIQELYKQGMDTHNVVVNQILHVPADLKASMLQMQKQADASGNAELVEASKVVGTGIDTLLARHRLQQKYLNQIDELYGDFNVVKMPLLGTEVRGSKALLDFSPNLITPFDFGEVEDA